jgi:hypothetical protein
MPIERNRRVFPHFFQTFETSTAGRRRGGRIALQGLLGRVLIRDTLEVACRASASPHERPS